MELFLAALIIFPIILFAIWFYFKPTSLWTGLFFLLFLLDIAALITINLEKINQTLALAFVVPIGIILVIIQIFGIYAMIIGLFWNERVLLKYERRSFSNFLPLIVASILLVLQIAFFFVYRFVENKIVISLMTLVSLAYFYFGLVFVLYSITAVLYNYFPHFKKVDYIIVLGAGLNQDKVTPLLAARIEAGVKLYQRQVNKLKHTPTIILSGGQGKDELISEAQAMHNYLVEKDYPIEQVYLEDQSTNTYENLTFSEKVAQEKDGIASFKTKTIVIATNNYHLLRAGKLAQQQGILARGIGAKTRLYYLPTAFMREYVGYLVMTKKKHLVVIGLLVLISLFPIFFK